MYFERLKINWKYSKANDSSVLTDIWHQKWRALDLQVMYLYKNLRTNIISQKDEDDEEAIDLKKDLSSIY